MSWARSRRIALTCGLALGVTGALAACALRWTPIGPRRTALIAEAQPLGAEECLVCHEEVQGHTTIAAYHGDCESCHGAGSIHGESEEAHDIRFPANGDCLACHAPGYATHLQWGTGEHSRAGLLCSDCHNPHAITERHLRALPGAGFGHIDSRSRLCVECHGDVASRLRFPSHHPILEGAMGCVSCHDPHEDRRVAAGDANQRCFGCHQDYAGPWIFEHAPVVDDCTICHDPHGAVTDDLLETAQPVVCLSCHSLNDLWHHTFLGTGIQGNVPATQDHPTQPGEPITIFEARPFLRRCTNCHGAIHGSFTDAHLRH